VLGSGEAETTPSGMPREKREQKTKDFTSYQNSVDLMGFFGADAESRSTRDGVPFTALSLATKRSWKDTQGECRSHADWRRVIPRGGIRSPNSRPA
jgi:hypothetical protein